MMKTLALFALTLSVFTLSATAQTPEPEGALPEKTSGKANVKNGLLTITTPKCELIFAEKPAWTIRQMSYNGKLLLSQTGAFGTVANSKGTGWEGTGHGHETVEKVELEVDGKPHSLQEGLAVTGSVFALHKQSRFGPYRHTAITTLDGETLHEKFGYEVVEDDSKLNFIYAFMHCMTNTTDLWKAQLADGTLERGEFRDDNSFSLQKDARWIIAYSSSDQMGIVYLYPETYEGTDGFSNSFWNRPRDNKLYFRPKLPRGIGTKFGYEITLRPFNAAPDEWEKNARSLVDTLLENSEKK